MLTRFPRRRRFNQKKKVIVNVIKIISFNSVNNIKHIELTFSGIHYNNVYTVQYIIFY